jgi:molybdenum cofactor cytidylyltransferase
MLLHRTARVLLSSNLNEVVVVAGHEADKARFILNSLPVHIVYNENYTEGQMSSVHKGLSAIQQPCTGVMICLADQPLLEAQDVNVLIDAFLQRTQGSVLVPTFEGKRGNPIILAYEHRAAILAGDGNLGCKRFIEKHPDLVTTIEMPNNHVVVDLDTPEDYAELSSTLNTSPLQVKEAVPSPL